MRRRRIAAAVAGVALVASAAVALRSTTSEHPPRTPALEAAPAPAGAARPLVYAEGQTIHIGQRAIRTGVDVLSLDVTDDGAAFTTFDGLLWFTDGRTTRQIGLTSPGRVVARGVGWSPAGRPNDRIVADWAGSRLAWLEYSADAQHAEPPELVVYDSRAGRRVARVSLPRSTRCPACAHIVSVHGNEVVWADGPTKGLGTSAQRLSSVRLHRYDIASGRKSQLSVADLQTGLRQRARTLVVGESLEDGTVSDAIGQDFVVVGRTLVAGGRGAGKLAYDPRTGRRLVLRTPRTLWSGHGGERFYAFQWLDDDTLALLAGSGLDRSDRPGEDILLCALSRGTCRFALRQGATDASPIVPEFDTPGADLAQARAARAQVVSGR